MSRRAVAGILGACLLGCAAPWGTDPAAARIDALDQAIADVDLQVAALRDAERRMVQEQLTRAEQEGRWAPETVALAERLGLEVPPLPGWVPADLDGRERGVTMDHGRAILDGVRREFHVEVDEERWGGAAAEALGVEAYQTPEAAIGQAIDAGMDESQAVVFGVEAALHSLDPYTRPVWPAQVQAWSEHTSGVSVGAGVTLDQRPSDGAVLVVGLHMDSRAWVSGLHVGDVVVEVDGEPVSDPASATAALAGAPGTPHRIGVERPQGITRFDVIDELLERVTAHGWRHMELGDIRSSTHQRDIDIVEDGISYVRLTAFVPETDDELAAISGTSPACCGAVVLDLRGNPGGDVQAALNVADAWLEEGELVRMAGRQAPQVEPPGEGEAAWNEATPGGVFVGACTVVLVDRDTASAAEILAGVLQQRAGAAVIGAPTAGKAVSQALRADDALGVAWQVTNLAWALPDGTTLVAGEGVTPDVAYEPSPAESWQTARQAAMREAPKQHPDGTPVPWLGPRVGEGFPELSDDPMVLRARRHLLGACR